MQHSVVMSGVVITAANALIIYALIASDQHKKAIPDIQPERVRPLQLTGQGYYIHIEASQHLVLDIITLHEQSAAKIEYVLVEYQQLLLVLI